jgi:hypothetical protein
MKRALRIRLPVALLVAALVSVNAVSAAENMVLQSSRVVGAIDHVSVSVEAAGERTADQTAPGSAASAKPAKAAVVVSCQLEFDEKSLEVPTGEAMAWRSLRHYGRAEATLDLGGEKLSPKLRADRCYVVAEAKPPTTTVFSPGGPLTRDELEILEVMGNSLLLDALLPAGEIAVGHAWKLPDGVVQALLGLDGVTQHDIKCNVTEITATVVRFEIEGQAKGRRHDANMNSELKGKYRFDLRLNRVDWIGLLVKTRQDISAVEAEMEAVIRVQVRVTPQATSPALAAEAIANLSTEPTAELLLLEQNATDGDWQVRHTRDWHAIQYHRDVVEMRLLNDGEFIAQCRISPLPRRTPDRLPALTEFQPDVQKALDKSYGELVEAGERVNAAGYRVMRVIVNGQLNNSPRQWRYMHVSDSTGRQVVLVFNLEAKLAERLDGQDTALVDGFRFVDKQPAAAAR